MTNIDAVGGQRRVRPEMVRGLQSRCMMTANWLEIDWTYPFDPNGRFKDGRRDKDRIVVPRIYLAIHWNDTSINTELSKKRDIFLSPKRIRVPAGSMPPKDETWQLHRSFQWMSQTIVVIRGLDALVRLQ